MASKSRAAQERLTELEKGSAPFEEQLVEAAKFIGSNNDLTDSQKDSRRSAGSLPYFAREEWLLKWLLKKLQAPKDSKPRRTASSWALLLRLLRRIPIRTAARNLVERQFISILQITLEEVNALVQSSSTIKTTPVAQEELVEKFSKKEKKTAKSLKRKRSGDLAENVSSNESLGLSLLESIHAVVSYITTTSNPISEHNNEGTDAVFSAEYLQRVIRTTFEESAKILGSWLAICEAFITPLADLPVSAAWLSPFIQIWMSHTVDHMANVQFSLYCTQSVLGLVKAIKSGQYPGLGWMPQLEQLLTRNIMGPAKASRVADPESAVLQSLTGLSIIQDVGNAPILFEMAIRSIKPHASKRRRASDDTWLQTVFTSLKDSMPQLAKLFERKGMAISAMLQLATDHKLKLDLPELRAITSEYALPDGRDSWDLVAAMIKLDANVFLIPDREGGKDLLATLLTRITEASLASTWPGISKWVVSNVLVPLMNEFARARKLTEFFRHWYEQLIKIGTAQQTSKTNFCSAWEDEALQAGLAKILEPSLTILQIEDILDWLAGEVKINANAVSVILDGIAASLALASESVIDAVGSRLYHIAFYPGASNAGSWTTPQAHDRKDVRYRWRFWRIVSRTVDATSYQKIDLLLTLWKHDSTPFNPILNDLVLATNNFVRNDTEGSFLESVEIVRLLASLWSAPESKDLRKSLIGPPLEAFLRTFCGAFQTYFSEMLDPKKVDNDIDSLYEPINLRETRRLPIWSYAEIIFVKYPKVLVLAAGENTFSNMLQHVFWIASASRTSDIEWLRLNREAYPSLWLSVLSQDDVLNEPDVHELLIDIMINNQTNEENPLMMASSTNDFTVSCLLETRIESFNKKQRERILKGWLPKGDSKDDELRGLTYTNALDPAILSLKIKIMENAMFYDGMDFDEFTHLAEALKEMQVPRKDINLALLKEYCRRTFEYVHTIPKETRNKVYIFAAFKIIKKKIKKAGEKLKHKLSYGFIAIFEVVLKVLADAKIHVVDSEDLESTTAAFKDHVLGRLRNVLQKSRKGKAENNQEDALVIISIIDALESLGVDASQVLDLKEDAAIYAKSNTELEVGVRLETFIFTVIHGTSIKVVSEIEVDTELSGDVMTVCGRRALSEKARALATSDSEQKLKLLSSIFKPDLTGLRCADKLLAAREVIISIDDLTKSEGAGEGFDLAEAYSVLCGQLWKTSSFVQFCMISETLELMLKTKGRSITQFNIDTTLGSIAIICSRNGPSLNPARANTIFNHLCHLFRAILHNHRLKLQGHMHLVLQTMQALLRCLFRPLAHTSKTSRFSSHAPWLSHTSPKHALLPSSAEAYTRLVTLICDPTESSIRSSKHNKLVSATEKWKNVAGWHMQFLLMEYVSLQLEMRMDREVREKLIPGVYAMFDMTNMEQRRAIAARLDGSQRAVFGVLVKDWLSFGKWKGN